MAIDKFIHEFDPSILQDGDLIPIDREISAGVWKNFKIPAMIFSNVIYISAYGSDSSGNGSILAPFASPAKAIDYAKNNGISMTNRFTCAILGGTVNDSAGQIVIPPYFNFRGETIRTMIDNSQPIIADIPAFAANLDGQVCFQDLTTTGDINIDLTGLSPSGGSLFQFNNCNIRGNTIFKGDNNYIITLYLYLNQFDGDSTYDFSSISKSVGNVFYGNFSIGVGDPDSINYGMFQGDEFYNFIGKSGGYTFRGSPIYSSINIDGSGTVLSIDSASLSTNPSITRTNNAQLIYLDNPLYFKSVPPVTITSNTQTLDFSTDLFLLQNTALATYTMPLANGNSGKKLTVKKLTGNGLPVTLQTQGAENFFTNTSTNSITDMVMGSSLTFESDGISNWILI